MAEYMFLLGSGWLPRRADEIAKRHDAGLCNYTDDQCKCGHGCAPHSCKKSRRHWFAGKNLGAPFDQAMAAAVKKDLIAAGILEGDA